MTQAPGRPAGKIAIVTGAGSVGPGWGKGHGRASRRKARASSRSVVVDGGMSIRCD